MIDMSRCRPLATPRVFAGARLLVTPLKGVDGQTYAIAQGNLIVGGFGVEAGDGSKLNRQCAQRR